MAVEFPQTSPRTVSTVDQLKIYDQMIFDWLGTFSHPNVRKGKKVTRVFATPDRAFAEVRNILNRNRRDPIRTIPYPWMSIYRPEWTLDRSRWNRNRVNFGNDINNDFNSRADWPLPYDIPYQIEVWARNRTTRNLIEQWMAQQFDNFEFFLTADFTTVDPLIGEKVIPIEYDGFLDTGEWDPGEPNDRSIRYTLNIKLRAWLWRPIIAVDTVKGVFLHFTDDCVSFHQEIATGDGIDTNFTATLGKTPIVPATVRVFLDDVEVATDDRLGIIVELNSSGVTGTVNYETGALDIDFTTAPATGEKIVIVWFNNLVRSIEIP